MNKIKIVVDCSPLNPRVDYCCLGIMLTKRFIEKQFFEKAKQSLLYEDYEAVLENKNDALKIKSIIEKTNQFLIFNLYRYEHGNVIFEVSNSNPFNDEFDSGLIGWIVVPKNDIRQEYGCKRISKKILDKIKNVISSEMTTYSHYCNGEVYGYQLIDSENEKDSCYGFFGYDFENNGILEYIPEKFHNALRNNGFPIDEWLDVNGNEVSEDEEDELMYA